MILFMLVHMSVFLMHCSCQPKCHVRDNKVLAYLLTYLLTYMGLFKAMHELAPVMFLCLYFNTSVYKSPHLYNGVSRTNNVITLLLGRKYTPTQWRKLPPWPVL